MAARAYAAVLEASKSTTARHQVAGRLIGKVIDAYDGDTCRVAVAVPAWDDGQPVVEYLNVRMLGYDAPEMKKEQLPYGREVKAVFRALVLDRVVALDIPRPKKPDPYGRVLAHMYALERGALAATAPPADTASLTDTAPAASRCWWCCSSAPAADEGAPDGAATGEVTADREATTLVVRKQEVRVPPIADLPPWFVASDEGLAGLIHVNAWMIANARVKVYDGTTARADWTPDELENGVA